MDILGPFLDHIEVYPGATIYWYNPYRSDVHIAAPMVSLAVLSKWDTLDGRGSLGRPRLPFSYRRHCRILQPLLSAVLLQRLRLLPSPLILSVLPLKKLVFSHSPLRQFDLPPLARHPFLWLVLPIHVAYCASKLAHCLILSRKLVLRVASLHVVSILLWNTKYTNQLRDP